MEKNLDNAKNEDFLEILKNENNFNTKVKEKISLVTTDRWLAQLGSRKK